MELFPRSIFHTDMGVCHVRNSCIISADLLCHGERNGCVIWDVIFNGDDDVRAICVITQEQAGMFELKNIVTVPKYQRKGYGQKLIAFIVDYYSKSGSELYVGTGDSPAILRFYEKCGFVKSHVVKNFFVDNYDHAMYEDGQQLIDMIYLKRHLRAI